MICRSLHRLQTVQSRSNAAITLMISAMYGAENFMVLTICPHLWSVGCKPSGPITLWLTQSGSHDSIRCSSKAGLEAPAT